MKTQASKPLNQSLTHRIVEFVSQCRGLGLLESGAGELLIYQRVDGKCLRIQMDCIGEVIARKDGNKEEFLQINFTDNRKIILTDALVGFKPVLNQHLSADRLPKVVTTPDLISFIEALEEAFYDTGTDEDEMDDVREYFDSILKGGQAVGFNLTCERIWATRLCNQQISIGKD